MDKQTGYGLCECGCGQKTNLAVQSSTKHGWVKGQPHRFILGHQGRGRKWSMTNGQSRTPTHAIWKAMRSRCNNPNSRFYAHYGGRGIKLDPSWDSFEQFLADMGTRPEGLSIERIDNDKGYSKENCKWATVVEQMNNRSNTIYVEVFGSKITLSDACRGALMNEGTVRSRLRMGWSIHNALFKPERKMRKWDRTPRRRTPATQPQLQLQQEN